MEPEDLILDEQSRNKLDGIVGEMEVNKESSENIQFVVNDFKKKYGTQELKKKVQSEVPQGQSDGSLVSPAPLVQESSLSDSISTDENIVVPTDPTNQAPKPPKEEQSFLERHFGWIQDYSVAGIDPAVARQGRRLQTGIDPTDNLSPIEESAIALESGVKQLISGILAVPNLVKKSRGAVLNPIINIATDYLVDGTPEEKEVLKQEIRTTLDNIDPLKEVVSSSNSVQRVASDLVKYTQGQQQIYKDGIIESFKKGKPADGFQQISNAIFQTAPNTVLILGTGGTGIAISGAASGASRLADLEQQKEEGKSEASDNQMLLNAYAYGSFDALSNVVLQGLGRANKELFKQLGKETVEEGIKQSFKNVLLNTGKEGSEEMLTQLGTNAADILILDSQKGLMDGVLEAGIIGFANAGVISAPAVTAYATSSLMSKRERGSIERSKTAIKGIVKSLADTDDPATIKILGDLLDSNKSNLESTFKKGNETIENLPDDIKAEVVENVAELAKLSQSIKDPNNVEIAQDLESVYSDLKRNTLLKINNHANQSKLSALPDKGLKIKEQAARELMQEFVDKGQKEFNISDEQITNKAIELLTTETQEQDAKRKNDNVKKEKDGNESVRGEQEGDGSQEVKTPKYENGKEEVKTETPKEAKSLKDLPDEGLALKEQAAKELTQEAQEGGLKSFSISDADIIKRAKQILGTKPSNNAPDEGLGTKIRHNKTFLTNYVKDEVKHNIEDYKEYFDNDDVYNLAKKAGLKVVFISETLKNDNPLLNVEGGKYIGDNIILINKKYLESGYQGTNTIQHEASHAYTSAVLVEKNKGNLDSSELEFREGIDAIYKSKKTILETEYGFKNARELVAEFLSNKKFRARINKESRTIFEKVKDVVAKLFKKQSGLELGDVITDFQDVLLGKPKSKPEVEVKVKETKKIEEIEEVKSSLNKGLNLLTKGFPVLTAIDKVVFEDRIAKPLEELVAKKVSEGLRSRNTITRKVAQIGTNWFNGLPRTTKDLKEKRLITGKQNLAFVEGEILNKDLKTIVGSDKKSLERVHAVLDPSLYETTDLETIKLQDLSENEVALLERLKGINEETHQLNYDLGFIKESTYNKFKGKYIGREYDVYVEEATDISEEYFPQNKIFDKIFKQRKEIDQWKIDHKITDPVYLTVSRMMQTQRNVAVLEYSNFISEQEGVVRGHKTKEEAKEEGYTILDGKAYGALNGKSVPNYIAEDFKGYFFANEFMDKLYDIVSIYDKTPARQFLKRYHTVYNPVVQIGNFVSNHAFAFATGVNVGELWRNLPAAKRGLDNKDSDYKKLVLNNILGADILKKDLAPLSKQFEVFESKEEAKTFRQKVVRGAKKLDDKARELYSSSDDIMKLSAFKALKRQGFNDSDAIERVFEGFQNYSTVGKVWDLSAKIPVIGNAYIKFQADLQRIVKNAVTKRPLSTAAFLGSLKLMALMASRASGEDEESRNIREARPFIPKINLGVFDIPLVQKFGNKEVNLARFISPYYNYASPNETWLEKLSALTPLQITQFEAQTGQKAIALKTPDVLLGSFWSAFVSNKDFRGKAITDPYASKYKESGLSDSEKFFNRTEYVARSIVPLASTLQDLYKAQMYGEDFYGRDKTVLDIVASKLIKIKTFDDKSLKKTILSSIKTINYRSKAINSRIRSIQKKLGKDLAEIEKRKREGKVTSEQYNNKVEKETVSSRNRVSRELKDLVKEQEKLNKLVTDINSSPKLKSVLNKK